MDHCRKSAPVFSLALFALMLGCVLLLVGLGGGVYGALVRSRAQNDAARASLGYLKARIAAADEAGAVEIRTGPEGDLLALGEPAAGTGYETRIYLYQGSLMEEYAPVGSATDPAAAQPVTETACFTANISAQGVLRVTTGEGTAQIFLHTGGAPA